ncbi:DUF1622 domain-containing protein [Clostridium sp. MB05]|uniref:DUF1622 domain-containing protein n=1 Tax=Clostridium sp. MB05 TaxID=3376682 RepID=UPI003981D269
MLNHFVETITPIAIHLLESMGILIIIVGAIKAFYKFVLNIVTKNNFPIKVEFAQSLTLALEFKLGAEILKTVIVRSLDEMYILAAIIVLRAILAFVIHWEMKEDSH